MVLVKTKVVNNLVDVDLVLKEGNAGVYAVLGLLAKGGGTYDITVNPNTTYREYWIGAESVGVFFIISSDDAIEYREMGVELIDGKYDVTRIPRTLGKSLSQRAAKQGFFGRILKFVGFFLY